jgi:hypothetical protein
VGRATSVIEDIRRAVSEGIASGKVILATASKGDDERLHPIQRHVTFDMLEVAAFADVTVIDDRFYNQHANVQSGSSTKPLWTTFDLLTTANYAASQRQEYRTNMRRSGFGFVPLTIDELTALVEQATIDNGQLVETAELKAIRESLQLARMSDGLQLPKENIWLGNVFRSFIETIKSQWHATMDEKSAQARSNWLFEQTDIRQWSNRYKIDGHPVRGDVRYGAQILSLAMTTTSVPMSVRVQYWKWLEDAVLKRVQDEQRELYDRVVQHIRTLMDAASEPSQNGDGDAG